jgi:uncharacterized membrane protein YphA (DoxX/SURF4 family)
MRMLGRLTAPLATPRVADLARALLALAYLVSGATKLVAFDGAIAEQRHFGLEPAPVFAALTIATQLGGSLALLFGRGLVRIAGAFALAGFTIVATLIAHRFWAETGLDRFRDLNAFLEHAGLVGGFLLVAWIEARR